MVFVSNNDVVRFEETSTKIHFWENQTYFQESDLINYISENSIFFKFLEENVAVKQTKEFEYKNYVFKDYVYAYQAYLKNTNLIK